MLFLPAMGDFMKKLASAREAEGLHFEWNDSRLTVDCDCPDDF